MLPDGLIDGGEETHEGILVRLAVDEMQGRPGKRHEDSADNGETHKFVISDHLSSHRLSRVLTMILRMGITEFSD
jgi:hypothetical protein